MTAVAAPPNFHGLMTRPGWNNIGGQSMSSDEANRGAVFLPRKTIQRTNSSSSISSTSSNSSTSTVTSNASTNSKGMAASVDSAGWANGAPRKRPQTKSQWPAGKAEGSADFQRTPTGRPATQNGVNGPVPTHQPSPVLALPGQIVSSNGMARPAMENMSPGRQPVLYLSSLNGTFERKTISVPFHPETLRIGRQTNAKTVPTPVNGYFDSKVLSRQHAEIWADSTGKIYIRDVKSSNGTFVNGNRLSLENRESEPHELKPQDRLELGIDIVSEDQRTVVHHKVAAKVEHAGYLPPPNNVLDLGFVDHDPAMGGMAMPFGGAPARGRYGAQQPLFPPSGRPIPPNMIVGPPGGMAQRQFWLNPPTVDNIIKRLHYEMRNARLQNKDLQRTQEFLDVLLTSDDIKNEGKTDGAEPAKSHVANGNSASFRSDAGRTRFLDPPAPPPSQPLPEKPDVGKSPSDVPSLKRITTERPKFTGSSNSPVRQDNQVQLMEMLANARKEADSHSTRIRDLEEMLLKEREARLHAEDMMQKMEVNNHTGKTNGVAGSLMTNGASELDMAFEPPMDRPLTPEPSADGEESEYARAQDDKFEASTAKFEARIDAMLDEMRGLREQLEAYRQRAEQAEQERDADRKTLAELVLEINRRNEEERLRKSERRSRSVSAVSTKGSRPASPTNAPADVSSATTTTANDAQQESPIRLAEADNDGMDEQPILSRANTTTSPAGPAIKAPQDSALLNTLPYASMIGVVLIGVGLMTYLNWQPQPRLDL